MLYEDLRDFGTGNQRMDKTILDKYKVEMVYYLVLKNVLQRYGTDSTRDIANVHYDALGLARDQMAMRASDQGLVNYTNDGLNRVTGFTDISMRNLISASIRNSEAVRKAISTHLASTKFRTINVPSESIDDFLYNEVEKVLDQEMNIDDENSIAYAVYAATRGFDDPENDLAMTVYNYNAYYDSDKNAMFNRKTDDNGTHPIIKISPLCPDLMLFRQMEETGLGLSARIENPDNSLLQYDPQTGILSKNHNMWQSVLMADDSNKNAVKSVSEIASSGIVIRSTDYNSQQIDVMFKKFTYDLDGRPISSQMIPGQATVINNDIMTRSLTDLNTYRMLYVLNSYSNQRLDDTTIDNITHIMRVSDTARGRHSTWFGDLDEIGIDGVTAVADDYFRYIDHVCKTAKEKISSHEFEIHVEESKGDLIRLKDTSNSNRNVQAEGYHMYFTGVQGADYSTARNTPYNFVDVYLYTDYIPANKAISPVIGDILSPSFNRFIVTDKSLRDGIDFAEGQTHKYFRAKTLDQSMIQHMRHTYDSYMGIDANGNSVSKIDDNIVIRKANRPLTNSDVTDLTDFITTSGRVDGEKILTKLVEDRDRIKQIQYAAFINSDNDGIFDHSVKSFMLRNINSEDENTSLTNAVLNFIQSKNDVTDSSSFSVVFKTMLITNLEAEIRKTYQGDLNMTTLNMHILSNFAEDYVDGILKNISTKNAKDKNGLIAEISKLDLDEYNDKFVDKMMSHNDNPILTSSLDEFFGKGLKVTKTGKLDNRFKNGVIKTNNCIYFTTTYYKADYLDMLRLLSYTDNVKYEGDKTKSYDDVVSDLRENGKLAAIQLFDNLSINSAQIIENLTAEQSEDSSDNDLGLDDDEETVSALANNDIDDNGSLWYVSMFAQTDNEDDISAKYLFNTMFTTGDDKYKQHAIYKATHPLQYAAMRQVNDSLKNIYPNYDPERLKITRSGIIYYRDEVSEYDGDGNVISNSHPLVFKLGPIVDRKAYIKPIVELDENGEEVERPVIRRDGTVAHDAQGKVITEKVKVREVNEIRINHRGELENEIMFGALDTSVLNSASATALKRFYGVYAKYDNYDGMNHNDKSFIDRLTYTTYQTAVMNTIAQNMNFLQIAEHDDAVRMPASLVFTNMNASSLLKLYHTDYIMHDTELCSAVDRSLSNYISGDHYVALAPEDRDNPYARAFLDNAIAMFVDQADMFENRVVMQKIQLDQNIGLYNTVLNLHECEYANIPGHIDRKVMLATDCKNGRVAMFAPNKVLDSALSATAKQLGAVGFFTDRVHFDFLTGKIETDRDADASGRCSQISIGATDFGTGGVVCRYNNYPGGQAVDRQQLSNNAIEKALGIAPNVKFAMINMGYNMEDGYVVAKRSCKYMGHLDKNGRFAELQLWDKIGDTESGNKGVVAKIVDTDIAADIEDDDLADIEFRTVFTEKYLRDYMFNYSKVNNDYLGSDFIARLNEISADHPDLKNIKGNTFAEKYTSVVIESLNNINNTYQLYTDEQKQNDVNYQNEIRKYNENVKKFFGTFGEALESNKIEPYYGKMSFERDLWRVFRDNKDLDLAVTNVCVLTRSNPSLLMYISDTLNFDKENGEHRSELILRRNGEKISEPGSCGYYHVYIDSHTAEDKNKDYVQNPKRNGRKYGSQELYALTAKFCTDDFIKLITANDETLADRILIKLNHKLMMNGFVYDPTDNLKLKSIGKLFEGAEFTQSEGDVSRYESEKLGNNAVIDMKHLAKAIIDERYKGPGDLNALLKQLSNGSFGKLLSDGSADVDYGNMVANNRLYYYYSAQFGTTGGNFVTLPECLKNVDIRVKHDRTKSMGIDDYVMYPQSDADDVYYETPLNARGYSDDNIGRSLKTSVNINGEVKSVVPLFTSFRTYSAKTLDDFEFSKADDSLQFSMYKTILAGEILDILKDEIEKVSINDEKKELRALYDTASKKLQKDVVREYNKIIDTKSLQVSDMKQWFKKNIYNVVFPNSLTCVWSGDPTLGIDEVGLSFEKAKSLGLLRVKDENIKDDYEHMSQRYYELTDDDLVLVNRSPGQTTGCIRALRLKITGEKGDGACINPACATIFDGDFDGDTVGILNYRAVSKGVPHDMIKKATREIEHTMTMEANLVHTADYTEITSPTGKEIAFVNPLFIAKNADIAIAMYNMKNDTSSTAKYNDISSRMDELTISANVTEQFKQIGHDYQNYRDGHISYKDYSNLTELRLTQIESLMSYYDESGENSFLATVTSTLKAAAKGDMDIDVVDDLRGKCCECVTSLGECTDEASASKNDAILEKLGDLVHKLEVHNKNKLVNIYHDMTPYMSSSPLYTHGKSEFEMLDGIIHDANISKKGKLPQLNALLMFSGVHARCNDGTGLIVAKDKESGKFAIHMQTMVNGEPQIEKIEKNSDLYNKLVETVHLDYTKAVSDVPMSKYKTQIESHSAAQADKSDGTGLGGSMAQKMQKEFGSMGYAELGLRLSGPVTQMFLDAKQNVNVCEKNLMVGKFLLNKLCNFEYIRELSDHRLYEDFRFKNMTKEQVRNGQFTFVDDKGKKPKLTIEQGVDQMNNFLKMINLPELSPIDRGIMQICLSKWSTNGVLDRVLSNCDKHGDKTYALMYAGDNKSLDYFYENSDRGVTLYSGSVAYGDKLDVDRLLGNVKDKNEKKIDPLNIIISDLKTVDEEMSDASGIEVQEQVKSEQKQDAAKTVEKQIEETRVQMSTIRTSVEQAVIAHEKEEKASVTSALSRLKKSVKDEDKNGPDDNQDGGDGDGDGFPGP